ncbi:hypothetical protein VNI00_010196 [Paramarasmius palmivorus]|uniref:CxC1-like cysteine cluster associated with KDZ transposases domain-containing protein n=1 Tax=Paramarasmius palmivorus TaxID=297713 RepID=A0AAW0CL88_9AGAR
MGKRKRATVHYGGATKVDGHDIIQRGGISGIQERWALDEARHRSLFNSMTFSQRDYAAQDDQDQSSDNEDSPMDHGEGPSSQDDTGMGVEVGTIPVYDPNAPDAFEWSDEPPAFPPGEEGVLMSHEGGEYGYHNFLSSFSDIPRLSDTRTRVDRTEKQTKMWTEQLPYLTDAYLAFKAHGPPTNTDKQQQEWDVHIMDFNINEPRTLFHISDQARSTNESLIRHGYLGASSQQVTLAFSFSLFDIYRQLHRVCTRLSIDALSKALQHIHHIPRDRYLEDQLRSAYDVYLMIMREVDRRCTEALGRQSRQAQFANVCPPCLYKVKDETPLVPSMLVACDGNNSLKMVDEQFKFGNAREDSRQLPDFRWVEAEEVDQFKDEVSNAQKTTKSKASANEVIQSADAIYPDLPLNHDDDIALHVNETEELAASLDTCVDRWRNAGPESRKKMFAFFAISGVFLSVCRHGHLLAICDMRRSGELMKYPLAIVNQLMEDFSADLCVAYDIMCAFFKTMLRSPRLRAKVKEMRLKGVVPAFHGHAHNRKCQLSWHPMYYLGVGMEDFEESYRRAVQRLREEQDLYVEALQHRNMTPAMCEELLASERHHFESRHFPEPPETVLAIEYVELLETYWTTKARADAAKEAYLESARCPSAYPPEERKRIETRNRTAFDRFRTAEEALLRFEDEHPRERWTSDSEEYHNAQKEKLNRRYRKALEELERTVVQRLFELTKLNMSGTGYKQREKITQALRARSEAIRKALNTYNAVALQMRPQKRTVSWNEVIHLVTVAEFDLLKDTHLDLSNAAWADPDNREVVQLHFRILRAKEEINRLNIEAKRLISFMLDDHADYYITIKRLAETNFELAEELRQRSEYLSRINARIAERLVQTSEIPEFTGDLTPGERVGRDLELTDSAPLPEWATNILGLSCEGMEDVDIDAPGRSDGPVADFVETADIEDEVDALTTFWERMDI